MKTLYFYALAFVLTVICSCNDKEVNYIFKESQSETIMTYRQQGYYEYNSRLNDSLWQVLESFDKSILNDPTIETITYLDKKIKSEKPLLGCYLIPWKHNHKTLRQDDIILLEWNPNSGVIIRVFTKSESIKQLLPLQSY